MSTERPICPAAAPCTCTAGCGAAFPHLTQQQVAERWQVSPRTLERWRLLHQGPSYLKIGAKVAYRLEDVEAYEAARLKSPRAAAEATNHAEAEP